MKVGEEHHFEWLKGIILAVFVLNVFDGMLTILWVSTGLATEANPFMDNLIHIHPALFMTIKLALVMLGSVLLWRFREKPTAVISIFGLFLVYYFLLLYHLKAFKAYVIYPLFG